MVKFFVPSTGLKPLGRNWEDLARTMRSASKEIYPDTFAIIDATELQCEVPLSLSLQSRHIRLQVPYNDEISCWDG